MDALRGHRGTWSGTNAFRMVPGHPPHEAPMTATVVAGGSVLTALAYTWAHPDDGPQEGLLALGDGADGADGADTADGAAGPVSVAGLWGDTWHQTPTPTTVEGEVAAGVLTAGYEYVAGAWAWRIVLDLSRPGELGLRMDNVGLSGAGADATTYWAMAATLRPAPGGTRP